jgi:hypothetical protein
MAFQASRRGRGTHTASPRTEHNRCSSFDTVDNPQRVTFELKTCVDCPVKVRIDHQLRRKGRNERGTYEIYAGNWEFESR